MDSISSMNGARTRFTTKLEYNLATGGVVAVGAAIGATASLHKNGEPVTVQRNTLLEFTLSQPVTSQLTP